MSSGYSRRGLFSLFTRGARAQLGTINQKPAAAAPLPPPAKPTVAVPHPDRMAIIQGRHCLALTSFCAICVERCPVPGAMKRDHGMPMVVADVCTGCGICHDVCPAPTNAVLLLPRRRPAARPPASPP